MINQIPKNTVQKIKAVGHQEEKDHLTDFLGVTPVTKRAQARGTGARASPGTEGRGHTDNEDQGKLVGPSNQTGHMEQRTLRSHNTISGKRNFNLIISPYSED